MATFKYRALNQEKKIVAGLIESQSENMAVETLTDKGLTILSFEERSAGGLKFNFSLFGGIKAKDIAIMSRQFSVLISASVALVQALQILAEQTVNPKLHSVIAEIADEVDGGARLSDCLAKRPNVFSNFYVNVVRSGETSGKLDEVLNYLADELEKDYDMMSKIKGAMIYPAFVFCGLGAVAIMMMVFVIPKLTAILTETGVELPIATRILIGTSGFMSNFWWLLIILLVIAAVGTRIFVKTPAGKTFIDTMLLKLPIFGHLFQRIYLVRFTRSLQTLIVGGVNISKGLRITAEVVTNQVYRDIITQTIKEVEDGNSISSIFSERKEIPKMVSQMLSIGEKTGRLDIILSRITDFYSREINNMLANLMTLMEPIIMVIMGIAVGIMVAAIILPMYNMAQGV